MNFDNMTVSELRKLAAELNVPGRSNMKKAELIAALSADEFASIIELKAGIAEAEAEEREMNEIRAEIAAEAAYIEAGIEIDEADASASVDEVAIMKFSANGAVATAAVAGTTVGATVTRERGRWVLRYATGAPVRAKTLGKVAKQWAKRLGLVGAKIDIATMG